MTCSVFVIGAGLASGAALVDWDAGGSCGGDCAARHSGSEAAKDRSARNESH